VVVVFVGVVVFVVVVFVDVVGVAVGDGISIGGVAVGDGISIGLGDGEGIGLGVWAKAVPARQIEKTSPVPILNNLFLIIQISFDLLTHILY